MMEYQFDYATFCKTFNVKDDKAIDSLRLTHTQDINFKLFPYKASGKAQAPIITDLEEVVSDFFRKSLNLETEPVEYKSLCDAISLIRISSAGSLTDHRNKFMMH